METIKLALAKGRLAEDAIALLERIHLDCSPLREKNRKLVFDLPHSQIQVVLLKALDVPTYVEHGVVDMGVVGKDVLLEQERLLYEVADLKFGACRLAVAGRPQACCAKHMRVATKYPNVARRYFANKGQSVEIIKQEGSVELAPLLGLSDVIVDIVETGNTLRDNGLVILEEVAQVSARLVLNKVSYKTKQEPITKIVEAINRSIF
ncbi:ATP phosphoribosyltransferase [Alkaliphilus crotonatoxidans]